MPPDLGKKDLLWADVDLECAGDLSPLWEKLGVVELVSDIELDTTPALLHRNNILQLAVTAVREGPDPEPIAFALSGGPQLGGHVASG